MEIIKKGTFGIENLRAMGFNFHKRKPVIVLARPLTKMEMPKQVELWNGEKLIANELGYIVAFNPLKDEGASLPMHEYPSYLIKLDIFAKTYELFPDIEKLNNAEKSLVAQGCLPYVKTVGVWAKALEKDTLIEGLEHEEPVLVKEGNVLCIGVDLEPYNMPLARFEELYYTNPEQHDTKEFFISKIGFLILAKSLLKDAENAR